MSNTRIMKIDLLFFIMLLESVGRHILLVTDTAIFFDRKENKKML